LSHILNLLHGAILHDEDIVTIETLMGGGRRRREWEEGGSGRGRSEEED